MSFHSNVNNYYRQNIIENLLITLLYLQSSLITQFWYEILAELYLKDMRSHYRPLKEFFKSGFKLYNEF